jgi:hypothetical protein
MYGVIPTSDYTQNGQSYQEIINERISAIEETQSNEPLTFYELCKYNTWFVIHPTKVAGSEKITTSREFPISIIGSKEDVIKTLSSAKSKSPQKHSLMKLKAKAINANAKAKLAIKAGLHGTNDDFAIQNVIEKSKNGLNGLGRIKSVDEVKVRTFDEILSTYNKGISEDELRAWAWKRGYVKNVWAKYSKLNNNQLDELVAKGALFYHDAELMPYPEYAYSNMYDRELQLEDEQINRFLKGLRKARIVGIDDGDYASLITVRSSSLNRYTNVPEITLYVQVPKCTL